MADSKMNPKPIFMDCHIEMHDKMLLDMQKSFKKLKKRIHRVELNLHLVPPDTEVAETEQWKAKVDNIINKERVSMDFPTIFEVSEQYIKKHPAPIILSTGEQILFRKQDKAKQKAREGRRIPLKTLHKLAQIRETKNFGVTKSMGAPETGTELKTVKNYKGCNTLTMGSRTIIRKDARAPADTREGSSLPEWFGPGSYENTDSLLLRPNALKVSDIQSSFKAPERYQKTAEDWREQRLLHRSWSTNYASQAPPEPFAETTKSSEMMFKSREDFQQTQLLEAERFSESQRAFQPDPYANTLGTPVLGNRSTMDSFKRGYKVRDWTEGGLSMRTEVFDPAAATVTFSLTEAPSGSGGGGVGGGGAESVEVRGSGGGAPFRGFLVGDDEQQVVPSRATTNANATATATTTASGTATGTAAFSPMKVKVLNKIPVPFVTKAQQQEAAATAQLMEENRRKREQKLVKTGQSREAEPWDQPIDCHKILRRNETNRYKHSRNMPVPTHFSHLLQRQQQSSSSCLSDATMSTETPTETGPTTTATTTTTAAATTAATMAIKKDFKNTSAAKALAGVPLKENIGPVLKKWYAEQNIVESEITCRRKPNKCLHQSVKVPLNTNNMTITRSHLAATRAAAKEIEKRVQAASGPHSAPIIDFNKLKLQRIENDLDSLLLPDDHGLTDHPNDATAASAVAAAAASLHYDSVSSSPSSSPLPPLSARSNMSTPSTATGVTNTSEYSNSNSIGGGRSPYPASRPISGKSDANN